MEDVKGQPFDFNQIEQLHALLGTTVEKLTPFAMKVDCQTPEKMSRILAKFCREANIDTDLLPDVVQYIQRAKCHISFDVNTWFRLCVTAFIVAQKMNYDFVHTMDFYGSHVVGTKTSKLIEMEKEFLLMLDYQTFLTKRETISSPGSSVILDLTDLDTVM